jgi:hypothetical protein
MQKYNESIGSRGMQPKTISVCDWAVTGLTSIQAAEIINLMMSAACSSDDRLPW